MVTQGIKKVALLGTAFTMEQEFYREKLTSQYNLDVLIPEKQDRKIIHDVIFSELCHGKILKNSKEEYIRIMQELEDKGAQGIILGCTEIGLLVKQHDVQIKLFDTTALHAAKAVQIALTS